jgi:predicted nucleic acid-binding protein
VILVDSNVLIDIVDDDPTWADWSVAALTEAVGNDHPAFNQVVVAEVGPRFGSADALLTFGQSLGLEYVGLDEVAALEAGKAFLAYRRNRGLGSARVPLPDFLIGGHAQAAGAAVLTRDARFYRSYFPQVPLIAPDRQNHD